MRRAVVVGATGQIGRVAVGVLARDGWEVTAVSRGGARDEDWPADVRAVRGDREDDAALAAAVGDGCDVLVDMVAVVYGMSAAGRELGYRPVTRYAQRLPDTVAWIEGRLAGRDWREAYPKMFQTYGDLFDYAAEDAFLAA